MSQAESSRKGIVIAIDGFSSSGKSTMAKRLARSIGYAYIDSGAMYRCVALYCIENGLIDDDGTVHQEELLDRLKDIHITFTVNPETGASEACLNGVNVESQIRQMAVSQKVSYVAAIGGVRRALVEQQRAMGEQGGIVMDGRDIGTTVFPNAEMKVYVDASAEVRAKRRYEELVAKGSADGVTYEDVLKNVSERDYIDCNRKESPLRKADDAIALDNSTMTLDEQNDWLIKLYQKTIGTAE